MFFKKIILLFIFLILFFSFDAVVVSNSTTYHKKPEQKVIKKQNKKPIQKINQQKKIIKEEEWITYEATFYNLCCNLTKSGRKLEDGVTVAVDPRIIPLGTWIEIKYPNGNIEKRRADDTGGAIKGRILDVYVAKPRKVLLQMGRQHVKVRIIKEN